MSEEIGYFYDGAKASLALIGNEGVYSLRINLVIKKISKNECIWGKGLQALEECMKSDANISGFQWCVIRYKW